MVAEKCVDGMADVHMSKCQLSKAYLLGFKAICWMMFFSLSLCYLVCCWGVYVMIP